MLGTEVQDLLPRDSSLELHPNAELGSERNSYRCAGAEEISQSALRYLELLQAGDGSGLGGVCDLANNAHVSDPVLIWLHPAGGNRKLGDVDCEARAGNVAIEDVKELRERVNLPALTDLEGARNVQIRLDVRCSVKFVE